MKKLAILTVFAFLLISVGAFAQDTTTTQQTTTTSPTTGQTTTTTRTEVDDDGDEWDYNHGSIGIFLDYIRVDNAGTNNFGLGGRAGFAVHPNVHLEGEIAYDFRESRTETIAGGLGNPDITYEADFRVLHGLFGPKFQTTGPVRVFAVTKFGFINFGISTEGAPAGFVDSLGGIQDGDTSFALYPGGGIELGAGWFAIRGEVGDEIYFKDGANHNLKLTIGPTFRF